MEKLLIIDDSEDIRKQVRWAFGDDYEVLLAATGSQALALYLKHRPRVAVLDLGLSPGTEGFRCLKEMLAANQFAKIIALTGNDESASGLSAIQSGAYDILKKPIVLGEMKVVVKRAVHLSNVEEENRKLRSMIDKRKGAMTGMVGHCSAMLEVFSMIRKVASSDVPVLIQGESGTGKKLVARAIHASSRRAGDFVAINCSAVPEQLLESELFGNEPGAANNGNGTVQGRIEQARGGTLFLDEIGELPAPLQVKLLKFLQDKSIQRIGGTDEIGVDVRVVAGTNRTIDDMKNGKFREDLYYRIGVVTIHLPPLRERKQDITLLGTLFSMRFAEAFKKRIKGFSAAAVELMESYAWPGNVRELENKIQRAVILAEGSLIEPHDLGFTARPAAPSVPLPASTTLKDARDRVERQMILQAMDRRRGNIAQAAEDLGISRPTFYDIMKKHGLFHMTHSAAG